MPNAKITGNLIGPQIKKARVQVGLKQIELSALLSVEYDIELSEPLISKIESGFRAVRDKEIQAICSALGVSPNELFKWKK